ncbi:MAG TPA: PilZ domain-containing protein [Candidatus Eremiobacteraceae bacterium]|nr:PilZ domain-containing protein [Candidatus Eremiobacteraceae bacterium]
MPEPRTPVMIQVEVTWEDQNGALQGIRARMEDKSSGGACIRVKTPIEPGSKVRIQWRFEQFSGIVKYCRSEGREYLVGIQRDATKSLITEPIRADIPARQASAAPVLTIDKIQSPTKRPKSSSEEIPIARRKAEGQPMRRTGYSTAPVPRGFGHGRASRERHHASRLPESSQRHKVDTRPVQLPTQSPKQKDAGKERKPMGHKWFQLATWRDKKVDLSPSHDEFGGTNEKESLMHPTTQSTESDSTHSAREVPTFEIELLSTEDVYRAAGITSPRKGYGVNKVVEMLSSEYIRGLSQELKKAAVLMALDAAGVSVELVQRDAKARHDALDSYETEQKKQAEAEWARKAEAITKVQSELESIKAHYTARISRDMEALARDKARFSSWVTIKQQEAQSMSEAVELCMKSQVSQAASTPAAGSSMAATAVGGSGAKP